MVRIALQRVLHRPNLCHWDEPILHCCYIKIEFMTALSSLSITTMLLAWVF